MEKNKGKEKLCDDAFNLQDADLEIVSGGTGIVVDGVVGASEATVHNCYNTGIIESNPTACGEVGCYDALVPECYNKGAVPS